LVLVLLLLPLARVAAQEQTAELPPVSAQDIDALLATLEDPAARDKLIQQLRALKAVQAQQAQTVEPEGLGAILLSSLSERVRDASDALVKTATAILNLPDVVGDIAARLSRPEERAKWFEVLFKIAIILLTALAAEWTVSRLLGRPRNLLDGRVVASFWMRLPLAVVRLLLELVPIVAFIAFAYGILPMMEPSATTRLVALTIINANVIARVIGAVTRVVFSPKAAGLRLLYVTDETANYIVIWVRRLTAVSVYGYFLAEVGLLLGLPRGIYGLVQRAIGLLVVAMLVILILQNRVAVTGWLKGRAEGSPWSNMRQRIADVWHFLAIAYVFAVYGVWALDISGGFQFLLRATILTVVVVTVVRLVTSTLRRLIDRGFALSAELKARFPGLEPRANRYLPFLQTLLRGAIYFFAALLLLEVWGLHAFAWLTSDFGRRVFGSLVTIGIILLVALLLSEIVNELVERYLQRRQGQWHDSVRSARVRTLLPLLRNAFRVLLFVMVTLIVLSELGINIAPLLAGAGVVGLAIGFGAQTLVKDVITGIFILAEDTVAVGDVVDLGGHSGVVEAMTLRSIRLRDHTGAVHTIPFSAVSTVMNMTRDFGYAVFDIGIAYSEDLDRVIDLLRKLGDEMRQDKAFSRDIREPIEVMGINRFADNAVIIRARLKTGPGKQWGVEREFNRRLKRLFEEHGIARANAAAVPTIYLSDVRPTRPPPSVAGPEPAPQS
jgi:moderate conductance mechanosensitive channel